MKKYAVYSLLLTIGIFSACGNSDKNGQKNDDSTSAKVDTSIRKTANAADLDTADVSFFENASYGGMIEVETSNKILQSTQDSTIKTFAKMMVKDHSKANLDLRSLAQSKGYLLPNLLPNTKQELIRKMDTFKDEGKDEYYVHLMIEEHQNAINLFSLASRSNDSEISKFASTLLPNLNHHYQHIMKLDTAQKMPKANQGDDPLKLSDRKKK